MELTYDEDWLREMVQPLLDDPDFLPLGSVIGFGLKHRHPVEDRKSGKATGILKHHRRRRLSVIVTAWSRCRCQGPGPVEAAPAAVAALEHSSR
jgi:hypothetical protein